MNIRNFFNKWFIYVTHLTTILKINYYSCENNYVNLVTISQNCSTL